MIALPSNINAQDISDFHTWSTQICYFHTCNPLALESERQHLPLEEVNLAGSLTLDSNWWHLHSEVRGRWASTNHSWESCHTAGVDSQALIQRQGQLAFHIYDLRATCGVRSPFRPSSFDATLNNNEVYIELPRSYREITRVWLWPGYFQGCESRLEEYWTLQRSNTESCDGKRSY